MSIDTPTAPFTTAGKHTDAELQQMAKDHLWMHFSRQSAAEADKALLCTSLATMAEALRLAAALLAPVIPGTTQRVFNLLGHTPAALWQDQLVWGGSLQGNKLGETAILFPKPTAGVA